MYKVTNALEGEIFSGKYHDEEYPIYSLKIKEFGMRALKGEVLVGLDEKAAKMLYEDIGTFLSKVYNDKNT